MEPSSQLDRIEKNIEAINNHLKKLNGTVARHEQTLHGPHGRSGLDKDIEELKKALPNTGTINTKTMWTALGSMSAIAAVIIALVLGLT